MVEDCSNSVKKLKEAMNDDNTKYIIIDEISII